MFFLCYSFIYSSLISEYETIDLKQTDLNPDPEEVYESISCKDLNEDSPDNNPCQIKVFMINLI